jgi:hypothetical protein
LFLWHERKTPIGARVEASAAGRAHGGDGDKGRSVGGEEMCARIIGHSGKIDIVEIRSMKVNEAVFALNRFS